jgi:hypothetical protein
MLPAVCDCAFANPTVPLHDGGTYHVVASASLRITSLWLSRGRETVEDGRFDDWTGQEARFGQRRQWRRVMAMRVMPTLRQHYRF